MHSWRKRVKDLRYGAETLERRRVSSSSSHKRHKRGKRDDDYLRAIARQANELGELLGEEHDLAVFAQRLEQARGRKRRKGAGVWKVKRKTRRKLAKLIARRRRKLRRETMRRGAKLYRDKPARFVRRTARAYARAQAAGERVS